MSLAIITNHVKSSCSPSISPIFRQTGVQMMQMMAFRFTLGIHESPGCVRSTSGTANSCGRRVQLGYPTKKRPRLVGFRLNEDKKNRCHKHIHPAQTNGLYFNLIQLNLDLDGVGTPNSHHPPRKAKKKGIAVLHAEPRSDLRHQRGKPRLRNRPLPVVKLAIVPKGIPHILGQ